MDWQVKPIDKWVGEETEERKSHPFRKRTDGRWGPEHVSGVDWSGTVALLERELEKLDAEHIVLLMDVHPLDIRNDGWIRANAKPASPRVILHFDSKQGHMCFPADAFTEWRANVRAIARGLEDLRRLDRYGITGHGEQYTGWLQIPATTGGGDPHETIAEWSGWNVEGVRDQPARALRIAKRASHPDGVRGDEASFKQVVAAGAAIGL